MPEYLEHKRAAMLRHAASFAGGDAVRETISAECTASDRTGVRRIRIGDFLLLSDSGSGFGGFGLGPSSPELLLGMLASCLTHTYLIAAAWRAIPLQAVTVRLEAENNDARLLGLATADPDVPFNIRARVWLDTAAPTADVETLHDFVEAACPLTKVIREPQRLVIEY